MVCLIYLSINSNTVIYISMKTIDFSYFIERYNSGEMSDDELIWFQKEIDGNDKLRNEIILRKHTDEAIRNQNIIALRKKLSEIEKQREINISVRTKKRTVYLKYAAAVTALIIIGSITMLSEKKPQL